MMQSTFDTLRVWTSAAGSRDPRAIRISRSVLLSFAVAMFVSTWAGWPNLIVDCGREMYVPAALLQGKRLYRDVWYPYGPLAPWVYALLYKTFGVHLRTLYGAGLISVSGTALILHAVALRFLPPIAALVCGLVFLGQGFQSSLFNFILPYSYAATLGMLLCLLTLLFLIRYLERRAGPNLAAAGLFAALAVVAKYELMLPCAVGIGLSVFFRSRRPSPLDRGFPSDLFALLPAGALAFGVYAWLIGEYGLDFLIHGNWMSAPGSYFMQSFGSLWMRQVGLRFVPAEAAGLAGRALLVTALWAALARILHRRGFLALAGALPVRFRVPLFCLTAMAGIFLVRFSLPLFFRLSSRAAADPHLRSLFIDLVFPQGMFFIAAGLACFLVVQAVRQRRELAGELFVTVAMGLALALRVMMQAGPSGYSIFSSSLLYLSFLIVLWRALDRPYLEAPHPSAGFAVAACFSIYALLTAIMFSGLYRGLPWPLIHTPLGDVRRTEDHAALIARFLPVLQQAKTKGQRVLLLPELTGLYFIAGIPSPSRYEVLTPGVLEPGRYTNLFLTELERSPPDLILLSNRRSSEYGADYFGLDYDQAVLTWIESRYLVAGEIGHFERTRNAPLAALIYMRKNNAGSLAPPPR